MIPEVHTCIGTKDILTAFSHSIAESVDTLELFEKEFAQYIDVSHARCVYSGRGALYFAVKTLGLKPRNKVIVPAYTSPIVPMVLMSCGLKPVYVSVNSASLNMDVDAFSKVIDRDTKAVVPIHMFGNPCEIQELTKISQENNIAVIEDAAQGLGSMYHGKKVGGFGDISIFSFGRGKNMTTMGGGMIATNRKDLVDKIDAIVPRNVSFRFKDCTAFFETLFYSVATSPKIYNLCCRLWNLVRGHYSFGEKDFLTEYTSYQATLGSILLKRIDDLNEKRVANAESVISAIEDLPWLSVQESTEHATPVYLRLVIKHAYGKSARDVLRKIFFKYGFDVPTLEGYCPINSLDLSAYSRQVCEMFQRVKLEITDITLALPTNPDLSESDVQAMVWILRNSGINA